MSIAPTLILAVGNPSRGDDALGPLLLQKLSNWQMQHPHLAEFELLEEFQLQIEHVTDLHQRQCVIFIDAAVGLDQPFAFKPVESNSAAQLYSHALEPAALLKTYTDFYQQPPPPCYVLCIQGEQFELGSELSPQASQHLENAFEFICSGLKQTDLLWWRQQSLTITATSPSVKGELHEHHIR